MATDLLQQLWKVLSYDAERSTGDSKMTSRVNVQQRRWTIQLQNTPQRSWGE